VRVREGSRGGDGEREGVRRKSSRRKDGREAEERRRSQ